MKKIFLAVFVAALALFSCTADLDQMPQTTSQTTASELYATPQGASQALAKIYASFVIAGQEKGGGNKDVSSNNGYDFLRGYFNLQECPTDEIASTWLSGDKVEDLSYMTWDANDPWVADTYYRLYYTIALCNEFLRNATDATLRAEARFLRALSYWCVLDLFGQGPFVDENTTGIPGCFSNRQLFDYVESELVEVKADGGLLDAHEYGHASKDAARALLARLYLNAVVYGAGPHYTECISACKEITGYTLEPSYAKLFNADNHKRTNEIIFAFVVDAENTVSWGASTYIVCGSCGNSSSQDPAKYGITAGWGNFRARGELPEMFAGSESTDSRFLFYTEGQSQWLPKAIDNQAYGYFPEKFTNLTDDGVAASNTGASGVSTDFPFFRLADINLMVAEAVLRGGNGATADEALSLVNDVRSRAGASALNAAQLTLDFILEERARELYLECVRRTDLIRFGLFTGGAYKWQWKGGIKDGRTTSAKYNVYPIPAAELSANPNMKNENY